jgi:hypothetical protein
MKWILSYRFTWEDPVELEPVLKTIHDGLVKLWFSEVFCSIFFETFFNEKNYSPEERYDYCIQEQQEKDTFIAFLRSEFQSNGVTKEFQEAKKLRQKIILIIKEWMEQFHPELVEAAWASIIRFETIEELADILSPDNIEITHIFSK